MLQLVRLSANKMGSGQATSPCSLVNNEGLIHWQESLFNQWRNARYSALCTIFVLFFFVSSSL